ncbi:MAG: indole-3-glycerol phosphate synthase TrpC [Candidatus Caenarcaniphilales bacterium]|jgi:indole-3-glycerol phosphate synthase|nr:indole-3-glycerol phosphate synthase TrpC [Candidatus Caenarcaniphilales bacterium]
MTKLDEIIENKKIEVQKLESIDDFIDKLDDLRQAESLPDCKGFRHAIQDADGPALIAEIKKASPSKGLIKENFDALEIAKSYYQAGAHCLSVLTDSKYFMGSYENLITVSSEYPIPCLCKEFIIDPKQIYQARLSGADAILLIVAALNDTQIQELSVLSYELGMDVLLEVHDDSEMRRALNTDIELIGINNRDLKTFEVSLDTSSKLVSKFRSSLAGRTLVAESGIATRQDVIALHNLGFKGFLVGEALIKQDDIKKATEMLLGLNG